MKPPLSSARKKHQSFLVTETSENLRKIAELKTLN